MTAFYCFVYIWIINQLTNQYRQKKDLAKQVSIFDRYNASNLVTHTFRYFDLLTVYR